MGKINKTSIEKLSVGGEIWEDGIFYRTVMNLMRHKSVEIAMKYAHLAPEHKQAAVERLGWVISSATTPLQPQMENEENQTDLAVCVTA
jgi:hypothetical protein